MDRVQKSLRSLQKASVNEVTTSDDVGGGNESARISSLPSNEIEISNLPVEILCHILSFLPTKFAVGTSILSTSWKNIFPLVPNLRIKLDEALLLHPESSYRVSTAERLHVNFKNFVDRLFNVILRDVSCIYSFVLILRSSHSERDIADWVNAALRLNVKEMNLLLLRGKTNPDMLIDSLYGCKIVSLDLLVDFTDAAHNYRFSLPHLKKLSVREMKIKVVNILLDGCPLVEDLLVHNCNGDAGEKLRICIPSLRTLGIVNYYCLLEHDIEVDCPNLKNLWCSGYLARRYLVKKLNSLCTARLNLHCNITQFVFEAEKQAAKLITCCSNADQMLLSKQFVTTLYRFPHLLTGLRNLVSLVIERMDSRVWKLFPRLLKCAPNLKNLQLRRGFCWVEYERFKASVQQSWSFSLIQSKERFFLVKIHREADESSSSSSTIGDVA